jgi:DNA polymerase-3 subunit alpha
MGKGWALFTVEDYNESFEFRIFGEQYLKFRHFLVPNSFIFMRALVREGWMNKETQKRGEPRLQFNSMQMLQEVMDSQAKKLTINMSIDDLKEEMLNELRNIIMDNDGDKHLKIVIYDAEEKVKVEMPSKKFKVAISNKLLKQLEKEQINYKLN